MAAVEIPISLLTVVVIMLLISQEDPVLFKENSELKVQLREYCQVTRSFREEEIFIIGRIGVHLVIKNR